MWNTPNGIRQLTGAEEKIFRMAVAHVISKFERETEMQENDMADWCSGAWNTTIFREMTYDQRIVTVAFVVNAMLNPYPEPKLTDLAIEAAVYEIYYALSEAFDEDRDEDRSDEALLLVTKLFNEHMYKPEPDEQPIEGQDLLIECLLGRLLHDEDFQMVERITQEPNVIINSIRGWREGIETECELFTVIRKPTQSLVARANTILREAAESQAVAV